MQKIVIRWWRVACKGFGIEECLLFAVPNAGKRGVIAGKILKDEGLRVGAPDLILLVARGGFTSLCLEMKTETGVVSDAQEAFHAAAELHGNDVHVCRSSEHAIQVITKYLTCTT